MRAYLLSFLFAEARESSCLFATIMWDAEAPTKGSIVINSGASSTTNATLTLTMPDYAYDEMYITETAGCSSDGVWETFSSSKSWELDNIYSYGLLGNDSAQWKGDGVGEMGDNLVAAMLGQSVTQISGTGSYGYHFCAMLSNGSAKCWGDNYYGQLGQNYTNRVGNGDGAMRGIGDQAGDMASLGAIDFNGYSPVAIAAGNDYSCAILNGNGLAKNSLTCWGYNGSGQLGRGDVTSITNLQSSLVFVELGGGASVYPVKVSASSEVTCAVLSNGSIKCWGDGQYGVLGQGSTSFIGNEANEMGDNLPGIPL